MATQKTCHNIAKLLNREENSPFQNKIMILGVATGKVQETLTQARFVESLLNLISDNPLGDRDTIKRGKKIKRAGNEEAKILILKNLFLDNEDGTIARIIWNYFKAVEKRWPKAWLETKKGNILNRTNGFTALMKFLRPVYNKLSEQDEIPSVIQFYGIFERIDIKEEDFNPDNYKPGSAGETKLYKELLEKARFNQK